MGITIKRAYEEPSAADGYRVLVDRIWPRGKKKEELVLDEWCKDIAPSTELREWFAHDPAKFAEFKVRYETELKASGEPLKLLGRAHGRDVTLVYSAKDTQNNQAVVLQGYLKVLARQ